MIFVKHSVYTEINGQYRGKSESMINITKRQKDILVGTLLGDGCLEINGKNARLRIDHSLAQKQLTDWIFSEFEGWVSKKPSVSYQYDSRTKKQYSHYRFSTISNPVFNKFYKTYYFSKKKIVPKNIKDLLKNPLSLAIWYMDDGFRRRDCNGLYLCTSAFTNEEHLLLLETLKINFDFDARVHFAAGNARIYIPASCAKRFSNLIKEFIVPDLSYKLIS